MDNSRSFFASFNLQLTNCYSSWNRPSTYAVVSWRTFLLLVLPPSINANTHLSLTGNKVYPTRSEFNYGCKIRRSVLLFSPCLTWRSYFGRCVFIGPLSLLFDHILSLIWWYIVHSFILFFINLVLTNTITTYLMATLLSSKSSVIID